MNELWAASHRVAADGNTCIFLYRVPSSHTPGGFKMIMHPCSATFVHMYT